MPFAPSRSIGKSSPHVVKDDPLAKASTGQSSSTNKVTGETKPTSTVRAMRLSRNPITHCCRSGQRLGRATRSTSPRTAMSTVASQLATLDVRRANQCYLRLHGRRFGCPAHVPNIPKLFGGRPVKVFLDNSTDHSQSHYGQDPRSAQVRHMPTAWQSDSWVSCSSGMSPIPYVFVDGSQ